MDRYICIHGHFYQPPRENPWLEAIELQDSAHPYRDWNERITAECYAPNAETRILDSHHQIVDIVNNYAKMSFNFGPTLLSWMQKYNPVVYDQIIAADRESQKNFNGHGAAIAQAYNHMIMPLANARDKQTQVKWGIEDFRSRFQREPEGMWLPETAVNTETLEVLAANHIQFTILSPYQANRVRRMGNQEWIPARDGQLNVQIPYLCRLPSGKSITIFFYDGPISQEIAFGDLLKDGEKFKDKMVSVLSQESPVAPLLSVANDGETFGHHHKFGNMALAYALARMDKDDHVKNTIYGAYLEKHPVEYEVEIVENSSWSCAHGIERWRNDCGCKIDALSSWNQKWRIHLRAAMDWLRDKLSEVYEKRIRDFSDDPWAMRDGYISVILNRSHQNVEEFIQRHTRRVLEDKEKTIVLQLLEMQRHAMLMYTSCGWFFDDISGIEPTQIIQYAARALQLAKQVTQEDLESEYVSLLSKAESNIPEFKNGGDIYLNFVKNSVVDLLDVGAHYAISSLFEDYQENADIYCYTVQRDVIDFNEVGKQKLMIGKVIVKSKITFDVQKINFAVLHLGDTNLHAGVRKHTDDDYFEIVRKEIKDAFFQNNIGGGINLINKHFDQNNYSLWDLFKNEQIHALDHIFEVTRESIESHFRQIFEQYSPLMQVKNNIGATLPKALAMTVEFILNRDLCEVLEAETLDLTKLEFLVKEIKRLSFMRDRQSIVLIASRRVNHMMEALAQDPQNVVLAGEIESCIRLLRTLHLRLDLWKAQNIYFVVKKQNFESMREKARKNDKKAKFWMECFIRLGNCLRA
jgi:alpha-amylase/alpha-mannosidase (GH57 family)